MSWVKLDDQFISHPKVMRAGPEATLLHVWGLCYSAQHLTDGKIPALAITGAPFVKRPAVAVRALVAAGLWHDLVDGEYEIHDYLVYNPTAEKVKGERDAAAERMRLAREKTRGSSPEHPPNSNGSSPLPVPVPEVLSEPSLVAQGAPPRTRGSRIPDFFDVTDEMADWAEAECPLVVPIMRETQQFVDYWKAASGKTAIKIEWGKAWKFWMRKAQMDAERRQRGSRQAELRR